METTHKDDPRARHFNEFGLYRLIARYTMEKAECFQDRVYENPLSLKVLPSIRKTESYSVQPGLYSQVLLLQRKVINGWTSA